MFEKRLKISILTLAGHIVKNVRSSRSQVQELCKHLSYHGHGINCWSASRTNDISQKESISNLVIDLDATTDSDCSNSSVVAPITNKKGKNLKWVLNKKFSKQLKPLHKNLQHCLVELGMGGWPMMNFRQMIVRKLSNLTKEEEKESFKLDIQILILKTLCSLKVHSRFSTINSLLTNCTI